MTFEQEIMEAIKAESADVKLNAITSLHRWTKDGMGEKVDRMDVHFDYVCGIKGGKNYEINSRDYDGIIKEVSDYTKDYLSKCADKMIQNLENGYR